MGLKDEPQDSPWARAFLAMGEGDLAPFAEAWRSDRQVPDWIMEALVVGIEECDFRSAAAFDPPTPQQAKKLEKRARDRRIGADLALRLSDAGRGGKALALSETAARFRVSEAVANKAYKEFMRRPHQFLDDDWFARVEALRDSRDKKSP